MTNVHLIVVQANKIRTVTGTHQQIQAILEKGFENLVLPVKDKELDGGYILMDLNTGLVFNEQNAFALKLPEEKE